MRIARSTALLVGRVSDQAALGAAMLLLAARLDVATFGLVSILFVYNSFAVTLAHLGLGQALLRLRRDEVLPWSLLRKVRAVNGIFLLGAVAVGVLVGGSTGVVVALGGVIWLLAGESHIRKSGAINRESPVMVASGEVVGATTILVAAALAPLDHAATAMGAALAAKHLAECLVVGRPAGFGQAVPQRLPYGLLLTQALALGAANVDYLVAWWLLGPTALGIYTLAFRVVNILPAQVSNVTSRLALVEFGQRRDDHDASTSYYTSVTTRLFVGGALAAAVVAASAPLLPSVLGERWGDAVGVIQVLALALPWRLLMGIAGSLFLGAGRTRSLVSWETARLLATTGVIYLAALGSLASFVVAVTIVAALSSAGLHVAATRLVEVRRPPWLVAAALTTLGIAPLGAMIIT